VSKLPDVPPSVGDDQEFFVDGVHEELICRLGRMQPRQTVIA